MKPFCWSNLLCVSLVLVVFMDGGCNAQAGTRGGAAAGGDATAFASEQESPIAKDEPLLRKESLRANDASPKTKTTIADDDAESAASIDRRAEIAVVGNYTSSIHRVPHYYEHHEKLIPTVPQQPMFVEHAINGLDPSFIYKLDNGKGKTPHGRKCDKKITIGMGQAMQETGLVDPYHYGHIDNAKRKLQTKVWGYGMDGMYSWPGMTLQVERDESLCVTWENKIPKSVTGHLLTGLNGHSSIDETLHWAYSLFNYTHFTLEEDGVPCVPHLHGGFSYFAYDGNPEFFFSPYSKITGPQCDKKFSGERCNEYFYGNEQAAGFLWIHDHALGLTRQNVYAGLSSFYFIRDEYDTGEKDNPLNLPAYPYEAAFVFQDRMFKKNGELFYPAYKGEPWYDQFITDELPGHKFPKYGVPTALAEYFGDVMVVNGKIWPKFKVERRKYRLRLLNGCDSRYLAIQFHVVKKGAKYGATKIPYSSKPLPFVVIGTDQGLGKPEKTNTLMMETGSRFDIIFDFDDPFIFQHDRVIIKNIGGSSPFGGEIPWDDEDVVNTDFSLMDRIMAFDVVLPYQKKHAEVPVRYGKLVQGVKNGKFGPQTCKKQNEYDDEYPPKIHHEDDDEYPKKVHHDDDDEYPPKLHHEDDDEYPKKVHHEDDDEYPKKVHHEDDDEYPKKIHHEDDQHKVDRVRAVALFEGTDEYGRLQPILGTAEPAKDCDGYPINWPDDDRDECYGVDAAQYGCDDATCPYKCNGLTGPIEGSVAWHTVTTENPKLGDCEEWEIWNVSADAHPIHLHLVHFEVVSRHNIKWDGSTTDHDRECRGGRVGDGICLVSQKTIQHNGGMGDGFRIDFPGHVNTPETRRKYYYRKTDPNAHFDFGPVYVENGKKDVVIALPGQVTKIRAKFEKLGRYVWHCHILSHEDHEMMRVLFVGEHGNCYNNGFAHSWPSGKANEKGQTVLPAWFEDLQESGEFSSSSAATFGEGPSLEPSASPVPSDVPSFVPSIFPSDVPTLGPSDMPSDVPSIGMDDGRRGLDMNDNHEENPILYV